jgi:transcription elongation factor Elf1
MSIIHPKFAEDAFNCPHCGAFSKMNWSHVVSEINRQLHRASCDRCNKYSLWLNREYIYPAIVQVDSANSDLPKDLQNLYNEAALILLHSPRASSALLRLVIDRLTIYLQANGKDLNARIADLVQRGLRPTVQQSLDVVRVVGNNAVHPGEIYFDDGAEIASVLFKLVNLVAQQMITDPKEAQELFDSLPQGAKDAIEKRDAEKV